MLVSDERLAYAGLIGSPSRRILGATAIYLAVNAPFELSVCGAPRRTLWLAVVPPSQPHEISSPERVIRKVLLEPESLADGEARELPADEPQGQSRAFCVISTAFDAWLGGCLPFDASNESFDAFFLGRELGRRPLDPRIARTVHRLQAHPFSRLSAAECARMANLSVPRFVHLFKEEMGTTLRAYCMWKRARAVLPSLTAPCNLTQLAMQAGYADSAHFSHSIRRVFGLSPRDIRMGSQRLALYRPPVPAS